MTDPGVLRVAVSAYCANNLGDDLFLLMLLDRYPHAHFYIFGAREGLLALSYRPNWSAVTYEDFARDAREFDAYVILGGSMFQEVPGWHRIWLNYMRRVTTARRHRVPCLVMGASFGPSHTRTFKLAHTLLFASMHAVSFRDAASASAFRRQRQVSWHPDLALAFPVPAPESPDADLIGISVMDFGAHRSHGAYVALCRSLVERYAKLGRVRLFAFQDSGGISDSEACRQVTAGMARELTPRVEILSYGQLDLPDFLQSMSECSAMITTRFHAMILALMLHQKVGVISYHPKVRDTLGTLGIQAPMLDLESLPHGSKEQEQALARFAPKRPAVDRSTLRAAALRHFDALDRLLGQSGE